MHMYYWVDGGPLVKKLRLKGYPPKICLIIIIIIIIIIMLNNDNIIIIIIIIIINNNMTIRDYYVQFHK